MYDIEKDIKFKKYLRVKSNLSDASKLRYTRELDRFCNWLGITFSELIDNCLNEQNDRIDFQKGIIIRFNKELSSLADNIEEYVYFCRSKNEKEKTILNRIRNIYSVLTFFDIILPKFPEFDINNSEWNLLKKEDINYILKNMNSDMKTVLLFLACTGERIGDVINWTIEDHMENTFKYHGCTELDEYVNTPFNPNTIAIYEFYPQKTKRNKILCRHGVTPETCEYIFNYIKKRKMKSDILYSKGEIERKLLKTDYLFAPRKNIFKQRSKQGIKSACAYQNKKLEEYYLKKYDLELRNNQISKETYESKVKLIPRFHAHALRKWFISTVRSNCSNLSVCVQMEGHSLPVNTDAHYVKLSKELIEEEYFKLVPFLSFESEVEIKVLTDERINEYEEEIMNIKKEYEQEKERLNNLEEFIKQFQEFDFDKID